MKRRFNLDQNFNLQESKKPSFSFSLNNNIHVALSASFEAQNLVSLHVL